jgi:large subunit ribosomal protein L24
MHVKKGDLVQVISGNDRGKTGEVKRALPKENRVVVEGINLRWRHRRRSEQHPQGERAQVEAPIHASKVKLAAGQGKAPKASKATGKKKATGQKKKKG